MTPLSLDHTTLASWRLSLFSFRFFVFLFSYGELSPSTFPGKLIGTCFPSDAKSWIKICCRWLVRPLRHLHTDSSHSNCCQQFCKLLQKQAVEKWGKLWEHLSNLFCWYLYTWYIYTLQAISVCPYICTSSL